MKNKIQALFIAMILVLASQASADLKEQVCFGENSSVSIIGLQIENRALISIDQLAPGDWARTDDGVFFVRVEEVLNSGVEWTVIYTISNIETGEVASYSIVDNPWTRSHTRASRVDVSPESGVTGVSISGSCGN